MGKSKIEWTEVTWNPVLGCSKVSQGCKNCYAMSMSARIANAARKAEEPTEIQQGYMDIVKQDEDGKYLPKWNNEIALLEGRLDEPLHWQKPRRVFVNSMSDLFHPEVPFEFIDKVFHIMMHAQNHTFQILTKRPDRMAEYFKDRSVKDTIKAMQELGLGHPDINKWPLPNVWLGTSVENQEAADERIPHLLECPAAVRFLSCEPLLGPVDNLAVDYIYGRSRKNTSNHFGKTIVGGGINWIIAGGESGPGARPMHPDWARGLRDQCQEADVPFFFKQWGKFIPADSAHIPLYVGDDNCRDSVSTIKNPERDDYKEVEVNFEQEELPWIYLEAQNKVKCRKLDGREWNQMPEMDRG